mmetsp:Transcript_7737/g.11275  ORF Transcript_7737/g.11275 Transcript_7737/m.11275 type:complete len:187 (+) Transcript_7737:99-659(+)|eukprot:CAMPEP_0195514614 /NCGR_PEP_ID=MMETSP0794_2-20130614/5929_1 /TAXON_ID=515487 /ORGANISM="Stephanopyxis turris, Strain CCMP 815" /LENGTH=186 /DNA_ID=CAMNT_0040642877 /DNA_START=55 /DNA_END=615 /DNA_ORIENTATION=+
MKTGLAAFALLVVGANAFTAPLMATRALSNKKGNKASPAPEKVAPQSGGYPSWSEAASKIKFSGISGGGNKGPTLAVPYPDFSDPKLQIERDPAVYAAAAKTRQALGKNAEFLYEDGLTEIERKQRVTLPSFLTGSAKSQIDASAIEEVDTDIGFFGLSPDRFQLLFISIFGLFTLVGCLSGALKL